MRHVIPPCSGNKSNFKALHDASPPKSAQNGFTGPELAGLAAIAAATLLLIAMALHFAPPCDARDLNTINGRKFCHTQGD